MAEFKPYPLIFVVEAEHPRLRYTLDTVLKEALGFAFVLQTPDVPRPPGKIPYFNYSSEPIPNTVSIPCDGLLYESHIRPQGSVEYLFPADSAENSSFPAADPFSFFFYRLSEYAAYQSAERDVHDRYLVTNTEPDLERLLRLLEAQFAPIYDPHNLPRKRREFDYEITIDVDHPWKFRHKGAKVVLGSGLKDLVQGRFRTLAERVRYLSIGKEPFEVFSEIKRICPAEKTTLFFLVAGDHANDSRFSLRMPAYRDLVQQYKDAGFSIGLHPSYLAYLDEARILAEKKLLESVVGPVHRSRQHYLRYRLPETFTYLADAGIREEYSICPPSLLGAKTGLLRPYYWFDLQNNRATTLRLIPAFVMDRTLQQYLKMSPQAALPAIKSWVDQVKKWKGKFVLILHNETFSETGEWRGWRSVIAETVAYLQRNES
ncbi:MAG TPA: hypothetical protein ENJ82_15655 [Bacteroidetes bacterium]|nr:hypothetical protein [Bacteroidota bacterium]